MILTGQEIADLCINVPLDSKLVANFKDWNAQLQPAGFDLTLKEVWIPQTKKLNILESAGKLIQPATKMEFKIGNKYYMDEGTYLFYCNEVVHMPDNITAHVYPRSTLMRMGCQFVSALVDAGYNGNLCFSITFVAPFLIEQDSRFAQIVFHKHKPTFKYNGQYQQHESKSKSG